jgi:translocator protein
MAKKSRINWPKLVAAIAICQIVGNIGTIFTLPALLKWYPSLNKPFFNPPNWLFGPAWLILYTLMGIALYIIWNRWSTIKNPARSRILGAFGIQLALNPIWSFLFFGLRSPIYGFVAIVLLWTAIVATMREISKISKNATYVLLPYIIWVSFALLLNLFIFLLNYLSF